MNILYCRKSSEDSNRQVLSIESQKSNLLEVAAREKLTIEKTFTESMSAKEPGRPEFGKLIALIKKNPGSIVFVWKLDRLSRNPVDEGEIKWLLQIKTIAKIVTPERTYYPEDNSLIASVEFGMATQYVKELSTNVKRGNRTKLENGGYTGRAPFGYLNDLAAKSVIVDELRAPYVEKIFRMFASGGYSLKDISNKLYGEGFRTKSGKKAHASMLYRMIVNPFFAGVTVRAGKHYQGSHTPLVSTELFDQAQSILSGHRPRKQKRMFPLTGYVSCPLCPCAITASLRKGHQYYHCTDGKKLHTNGREHFRAEVLNEELAGKFKGLQFDIEMIEGMYKASLEENQYDGSLAETQVQNVVQQQKLLAQRRGRLEDTYLDGSNGKRPLRGTYARAEQRRG
jgi:site-specific DNA recombinase